MKNTDEIKTRWVNADDCLPEAGNLVLILYEEKFFNSSDNKDEKFEIMLERTFGVYDGEEWFAYYPKFKRLEHYPVRYWMYLPEYDRERKSPTPNRNKKNQRKPAAGR